VQLGLTPWDMNYVALPEQAGLAERWGYHSIWLPENHFSGDRAVADPMLLLASMASVTSRLRLGTTSYLLPLRHPLQAAEQVAVLDQLSGGRLILGLGRGYQAATYSAFGIAMRQKRAIFTQTLEIMQRAWAGEELTMLEGAEPVRLGPLPLQRPHPPLWVAAFGPKALAQVGALGLPYLASPVEGCSDLQANYELLATACADAGHPRPNAVPIMRTMFVSEDASEVRDLRGALLENAQQMAKQGPAHLVKAAKVPLDDQVIVGDAETVKREVERYKELLGVTHIIATRPRVSGLAPDRIRASAQRLPEILS